jgi:hypothetical protein
MLPGGSGLPLDEAGSFESQDHVVDRGRTDVEVFLADTKKKELLGNFKNGGTD